MIEYFEIIVLVLEDFFAGGLDCGLAELLSGFLFEHFLNQI
jgi:hypothetical protein